jgi:hypothetical protein
VDGRRFDSGEIDHRTINRHAIRAQALQQTFGGS